VTGAAALEEGERRLSAAGITDPNWDAEALLRHVLGWDRATWFSQNGQEVPPEPLASYMKLVAERARRRPLQHLIGKQPFWRHDFDVSPDALIPRRETELIVEAALGLLANTRALVADVGTGTGCIALSLAAERPLATIHAVDISPAALDVAKKNARKFGLEGRVHFHHGDLLAPLAPLGGGFDLVASNPPYIDPTEVPKLPPEVRDYEPQIALIPSGDRYSVYRRLAPQARQALRPGGALLVEIGLGMEGEVRRICEQAELEPQKAIADLQGIPRTLLARRRG